MTLWIKAILTSLVALSSAAHADDMKLAVTTSFANSGLAEVLLPEIEKDLDLEVQMLVVGTGQALLLGARGDVDAVLVHARRAEEAWLAEGHGLHRTPFMYNDFVVIGPDRDPADIRDEPSAAGVFAGIARARAIFVSRGDDSGTHQKELEIWQSAKVTPEGDWYRAVGQGMGATLNAAVGMDGYTLSDRASWLNFGNKAGMALLYAGDPALFNQYAYLPVSDAAHPGVNIDAALRLEGWLVSERAQELIDGYRLAGEQLFTFNYAPDAADD